LFSSITGYVAIGDASVGVTAAGTSEKIYKLHTNTELLVVINDGKDVKLTVLQKFNVKKAQVLAAADEAAVDAITW